MPSPDGLTTPSPIEEKKIYPPTQWWPLRVIDPWHKFGFLVLFWVAGFVLGWLLSLAAPGQAGLDVFFVLNGMAVIALARSFRGYGEAVRPPRPWWRLTARPLGGWWLAAYYLIPSIAAVTAGRHSDLQLSYLSSIVLGVAFANSSIRLMINRRRTRSTHPQS